MSWSNVISVCVRLDVTQVEQIATIAHMSLVILHALTY